MLILSPASVGSSNVLAEAAFAIDEGKEVIPVLYLECKIPFRLRPFQYADFRTSYDEGLQELLATLENDRAAAKTASPTAESTAIPAAALTERESKTAEEKKREEQLEQHRLAAEQARLEEGRKEAAANKARLEQEERERKADPGLLVDRLVPEPRVVDAAIPSHVVKDLAAELLVLIRLPHSPGLNGILQREEGFEAQPEDVRSRPFKVVFPLGPTGRPEPLKITVKVTSPDFSPPAQAKNIFVPPEKDSDVYPFVLTPKRVGRLTVLVELEWEDAVRGHRSLLTSCVAEATETPARQEGNLVQMHMTVGTGATGASTVGEEPFSRTGSVVLEEGDHKAAVEKPRMMQGHWTVRDEDGIHRVHAEIIWGFPRMLTITWDGITLESLSVGLVAGDLRSFQRSGHSFKLSDKGVGIFDKLDAVGIFGKLVLFMDGVEVPRMEDSKKEAKKLLRDLKQRDAAALRRYQAFQPGDLMPEPSLEAAQHVIAREQGFASWRELMGYLGRSKQSDIPNC